VKASKVVFLVFLGILSLCVINTQPVKAAENSWTTKAPMPTARTGLGVTVVNGKIYAIGGINENGYLATCEEYNPVTDTWVTKTPMPTPRAYFAIAAYQNKIYVIAGEERSGYPSWANEVFDPLTDTWETKANVPFETGREFMSANVVNGKIYVISGLASLWPPWPNSNENYVYDPSTDTWTTRAPIPRPVHDYASAAVGNKIYIIGGRDFYSSPSILNLTQIYDTVADTWSFGAPMPTATYYVIGGLTAGVSAPQRIYVLGGFTSSGPPAPDWLNLTRVYDPETDAWTTGAPAPSSFARGGVVVVDDIVYAIGGNVNLQYTPIGYRPPPDTTPPTISFVSPENETYTVTDVPLTFTVSEPTSWIGYSLDGQAIVTIAGNTTLTGLSDGSHSLTVYANDTYGNTGTSETIYFSIKTQPSELFPTTWIVVAVVAITVIIAVAAVALKKRHK
jgi:N-acetylneuraminic acid mutarotase